MTPAEIAQETLELLNRDGWCKESLIWLAGDVSWLGQPGNYRTGSRCLIGAAVKYSITRTETLDGLTHRRYEYQTRATQEELREFTAAARKVIDEQFPGRQVREKPSWFGGPDIVEFNNHPDTTFADITLVLEKVIAG